MPPRRRKRAARSDTSESIAVPAYIKRKIPFYEFLDEEGLVKIEEQADWLMQDVGIAFKDDESALATWRDAGADVEGTRVRASGEMIRALCKTAPTEFTQLARNPDRSVRIGGANQVFAPVYGSPFVRHLDMLYCHMRYSDKPHLGAITEKSRAKDTQTRAYERWNTMLEEYEAPPIDAATDEALQDYVRRRKDEIPDAWY